MNTQFQPKYPLFRGWTALAFLLLAGLAFLQFHRLDLRPLHNDEGVNSLFMQKLIEKGEYKYDPQNYHGPSLYYFHLLPVHLNTALKTGRQHFNWIDSRGLTPTAMRIPTALAGFLVLIAILCLRRSLGPIGVLVSVIILGLSSNYLYFTRYFIHEPYVVLFTLLIFMGFSLFTLHKRPAYLYVGFLSVALLYCTKETSVVHFFVLLFSHFCALWLAGLLGHKPFGDQTRQGWNDVLNTFRSNKKHTLFAILISVFIAVVLYSSFFSNKDGVLDSLRGFTYWGEEGVESGHVKSFFYFLESMLFRYEFAALVLAVVGLVTAFLKADRLGLYLSFWMLGMLGAYSVIPYKTPWLVINILLPMALLGGYGVQNIFVALSHLELTNKKAAQSLVGLVVILILLLQVPLSMRVNFKEYDSIKHTQIYQHTHRQVLDIADEADALAERTKMGFNLPIHIVVKEYWPLPYYFRRYKKVSYHNKIPKEPVLDNAMLIVEQKFVNEVRPKLSEKYREKPYKLRDEVWGRVFINEKYTPENLVPLPRLFTGVQQKGELKPGLHQTIYYGMHFKRGPAKKVLGATDLYFSWDKMEDKVIPSPFSIRWQGLINIPKEGPYTFHLESDDGSFLWIDDYLVIDNGGTHAPLKKSRTINLTKGYHLFELKFFDWLGEAVLKCTWTQPDSTEQIIHPELFKYEKP